MLGGYNTMNKMFKVLMFGIMLAVLAVGSAVPSFGQQDDQKVKTELRAKFMENYDKDMEKRKVAVQAGKEYLQKFGDGDETADPLIAYFKDYVPVLEKQIKEAEQEEIRIKKEKAEADENAKRIDRFSKSVIGKNYAEVFAGGKDILANRDDYLDVYIVLATIGYDRAVEKDNTYNDEAIKYAKKAIQLIEKGVKSDTEKYGAEFGKDSFYQYNDKENALGWLNFNIGYILKYNQNKPKEALPYLYEATKHNSLPQKSAAVYRMIGEYYYDEVARLEKERQAIRTSLGNKDNERSLELFAMEKGYADRGADAYARAHALETDATAKQGLYDRFNRLYTFSRNNKSEGADQYLSMVKTKPLPNPTTAVQPIVDEADKEIEVIEDTKTKGAPDGKPAMTDKDKPATKPADAKKPGDTMMKKPPTKPRKS